jgi:hypothetical protein
MTNRLHFACSDHNHNIHPHLRNQVQFPSSTSIDMNPIESVISKSGITNCHPAPRYRTSRGTPAHVHEIQNEKWSSRTLPNSPERSVAVVATYVWVWALHCKTKSMDRVRCHFNNCSETIQW